MRAHVTATTPARRSLRLTRLTLLAALASAALQLLALPAQAAPVASALVVQDQVALRGAARDSAPSQAQLWRGEALEIRGERLDHWQVYDYRRERGGFVRKSQLLVLDGPAAEPAALLAALRLVRQQPGAEALGLGLAAAYAQSASAEQMAAPGGVEALDALGTLAERLADRASRSTPRPDGSSSAADTALAAQLDVAARYGLRFQTLEREAGQLQQCYDGEVFRRVLALSAATPEQQARAALALTRPDCLNPAATPAQREQRDLWRAEVLERVRFEGLAPLWRNRVLMRRVGVWSSLAYAQARRGDAAALASAGRALNDHLRVQRAELAEDDQPQANDAAMRANAARWLASDARSSLDLALSPRLQLRLLPGEPGQTCLLLQAPGAKEGLLRHCSWGLVMPASARINREGNAIALAVQPADGWRELWLLRKTAQGWRLAVLPPAAAGPGLGYAEFAGWVPGGQQVLVAREARAEGRYRRGFELMDLDTLEVRRQAGEASLLGPFQRWQDPEWKAASLSTR